MRDDYLYSPDPATEELTIEANAHEDYLAELRAEHHDPLAGIETDEEAEQAFGETATQVPVSLTEDIRY